MTYTCDENGKLKCGNCGCHTLDMVVEQRISDVSRDGDDPVANRTIDSENIVSLVCARCGAQVR